MKCLKPFYLPALFLIICCLFQFSINCKLEMFLLKLLFKFFAYQCRAWNWCLLGSQSVTWFCFKKINFLKKRKKLTSYFLFFLLDGLRYDLLMYICSYGVLLDIWTIEFLHSGRWSSEEQHMTRLPAFVRMVFCWTFEPLSFSTPVDGALRSNTWPGRGCLPSWSTQTVLSRDVYVVHTILLSTQSQQFSWTSVFLGFGPSFSN